MKGLAQDGYLGVRALSADRKWLVVVMCRVRAEGRTAGRRVEGVGGSVSLSENVLGRRVARDTGGAVGWAWQRDSAGEVEEVGGEFCGASGIYRDWRLSRLWRGGAGCCVGLMMMIGAGRGFGFGRTRCVSGGMKLLDRWLWIGLLV